MTVIMMLLVRNPVPLVLHLLSILVIIKRLIGWYSYLYAAMYVLMVLTAVCFVELNCTELYLNKTSVDQLTIEHARYNHICRVQIDSLQVILNSV